MDISNLKREPQKVRETFMENKNHELITKTGCTIYVPANYTEKGLGFIAAEVSILGIFMVVIKGGYYAVSDKATSMITLGPCLIDTVKMGPDEEEYLKFEFEPGAVVMKTTLLVKDKKLTNAVLDYFVDFGHSPWFFNYLDLAELLRETPHFNDIKLGGGQPVYDMIVAPLARTPKDITSYYRHFIKSEDEIYKRPLFVPTRDIALTTTSNLASLNGSELQRGIKAALTREVDRSEPLEELFIK